MNLVPHVLCTLMIYVLGLNKEISGKLPEDLESIGIVVTLKPISTNKPQNLDSRHGQNIEQLFEGHFKLWVELGKKYKREAEKAAQKCLVLVHRGSRQKGIRRLTVIIQA
jgi:hypothetical protein